MAVVEVSRRDGGDQKTAIRVGQRVAFAAYHTPGWIVAAFSIDADAARARRLRIHDGTRRAGLTPGSLAVVHRESVGEALEHARS